MCFFRDISSFFSFNQNQFIILRERVNWPCTVTVGRFCGRSVSWLYLQGGVSKCFKLLKSKSSSIFTSEWNIFQCMGKIFCVEFQRVPLKFHTKYLAHTLKDMIFYTTLKFKELLDLHFWNAPSTLMFKIPWHYTWPSLSFLCLMSPYTKQTQLSKASWIRHQYTHIGGNKLFVVIGHNCCFWLICFNDV